MLPLGIVWTPLPAECSISTTIAPGTGSTSAQYGSCKEKKAQNWKNVFLILCLAIYIHLINEESEIIT